MDKRIIFLVSAAFLLSLLLITPPNIVFSATKVKVNANVLNVRENASVDSQNLGQLKKGKEVTIAQEKNGWSKIKYGTSYGWVSSKYLTKTKDKAKSEKNSKKEGYVTATSLNLRKSPSTHSVKLASLKNGEVVQIKSTSGDWYKVHVPSNKKTGWVFKSYISSEKTTPKETNIKADLKSTPNNTVKGTTYYVTATSLNIRKEPTTSSQKLFTVKKNEKVMVSQIEGKWGKITTASGKIGWASLSYLTTTNTFASNGLGNIVIVIDAGHGGLDPGAVGEKYNEKNLTLSTAKELERLLKAAGTKVIMTREGDTYPTLTERVNISHQNDADVFISLHYNSNVNKQANGIDTFYYDTNVNEQELANLIQEEVIKATGLKNRGIKEGNFQVIRTNTNAAILIELGFISNPEEEKIIATKDFQIKAATGIMKGLEKYFSK